MKLKREDYIKTNYPDGSVSYDYTCNGNTYKIRVVGYGRGRNLFVYKNNEFEEGTIQDVFTTQDNFAAWEEFERLVDECSPKPDSSGGFSKNPQANPNVLPLLAIKFDTDKNNWNVKFFVQVDVNANANVTQGQVVLNEFELLQNEFSPPTDKKMFEVDWTQFNVPDFFKCQILMKSFDKLVFEQDTTSDVFLFIPKGIMSQGTDTEGGQGGEGDDEDGQGGGQKGGQKGGKKGSQKGGQGGEGDDEDGQGGEGDDEDGQGGGKTTGGNPFGGKKGGKKGGQGVEGDDEDGQGGEGDDEDGQGGGKTTGGNPFGGKKGGQKGGQKGGKKGGQGGENDDEDGQDGEDDEQDGQGGSDYGGGGGRRFRESPVGDKSAEQIINKISEVTGVIPENVVFNLQRPTRAERFLVENDFDKIKSKLNLPKNMTPQEFAEEVNKKI